MRLPQGLRQLITRLHVRPLTEFYYAAQADDLPRLTQLAERSRFALVRAPMLSEVVLRLGELAANRNHPAFADYEVLALRLLDQGAEMSTALEGARGYSLMTCALRLNSLALAERLYQHGCPLDHPDNNNGGRTPLAALAYGELSTLTSSEVQARVAWLLERGADPDKVVLAGVVEASVARQLLDNGLSLQVRDQWPFNHRSLVEAIADAGDTKSAQQVIRVLLAQDLSKLTATQLRVGRNEADPFDPCRDDPDPDLDRDVQRTALGQALRYGQWSIAQAIIERDDFDPQAPLSAVGETALHLFARLAMRERQVPNPFPGPPPQELVRLWLEIDPLQPDQAGQTPVSLLANNPQAGIWFQAQLDSVRLDTATAEPLGVSRRGPRL